MSISGENITPSRRYADNDKVTVGLRIVYTDAQAQRYGLLSSKTQELGNKTLKKALHLFSTLGCRPTAERTKICATMRGAIDGFHLDRRFSDAFLSTVARKVNQLSIDFFQEHGVECIIMYVLPKNNRELRNHPPWKAVHAYAGDPVAVGVNLDSRIREVLSRNISVSGSHSSLSSEPCPLPARPQLNADAMTSPVSAFPKASLDSVTTPSDTHGSHHQPTSSATLPFVLSSSVSRFSSAAALTTSSSHRTVQQGSLDASTSSGPVQNTTRTNLRTARDPIPRTSSDMNTPTHVIRRDHVQQTPESPVSAQGTSVSTLASPFKSRNQRPRTISASTQLTTSTQSSDERSLLKRIGPEITPDDASSRPAKLRKLNQDDSRSPDHVGSVDPSFTPAAWSRTTLPTPPPSLSRFPAFSGSSGMQRYSPDIGVPPIPGTGASMVNAELRHQPTIAKTGLGDLLAENTRLKRTNDTYAREVQMHEEHIQTLQNQVSLIPELHAQIQTLEYNSDVLQRELDDARARAAGVDVARRESTEQLSAARDENRRLAAQVASLEAQASRIPMLERDVQSRTDRLRDLNARLEAGDAAQRSILAHLRRSLGDQNGFWDDAPLSMVLLAIESELHKLRSTSRRALLAEEEAVVLRARAKALESMDPTVLPSMVEALAQIASLTSGLAQVSRS